jgi:hypothetical protein
MPFIKIETRPSFGKKSKTKRVIIYSCDFCFSQIEKRYKESMAEKYKSGTLLAFCNKKCLNSSLANNQALQNKIKKTCLERYDGEGVFKSKSLQDKKSKTCIDKYGTPHFLGSDACKLATQKCLNDLNVNSFLCVAEVREKFSATLIKNYGVIHPLTSDIIKEKIRINCKLLHNVDWHSQRDDVKQKISKSQMSPECQEKRNKTLKENGTCKKQSSKAENVLFEMVKLRYPQTQQHVSINKWNIDLFVPEIETYINYNGVYWHGKNRTDDDLLSSHTKQSKTIFKTRKRDDDRTRWFKENNKKFVVIWEDEFNKENLDKILSEICS